MLFSLYIPGLSFSSTETTYCEQYSYECKGEPGSCNKTEQCEAEDGKRAHCYASWRNSSNTLTLLKKGCWLDDPDCYDMESCVEQDFPERNDSVYFCCCEGSLCNKDFSYIPVPTTPKPTKGKLYETCND